MAPPPPKARRRSRAPLVSIITPTASREAFLPFLVEYFAAQTYPRLELLILDDSPQPAPRIADSRVTYLHSSQRLSVGEKRNRLVEAAKGEIIVHFDDDDYYAPDYITRMVAHLGEHDLVKLSGWFAYHVAREQFFYWQTDRILSFHYAVGPGPLRAGHLGGVKPTFVNDNLFGYGFSFVYRRAAALTCPFPDVSFAEDLSLAESFRGAGRSILLITDDDGLALHVLHRGNSSRIFPQFLIPNFIAHRLFSPTMIGRLPRDAGSPSPPPRSA